MGFETLQKKVEKILLEGEIKKIREVQGGANKAFLVEIESLDILDRLREWISGNCVWGVFKPLSRENPQLNKTHPNQYKRERAAHLVNKILGLNLIPATVIREINNEPGSLQLCIPDAIPYLRYAYIEDRIDISSLLNIGLLNYINYNVDNRPEHLVIQRWFPVPFLRKEKWWLVDNGLTFAPVGKGKVEGKEVWIPIGDPKTTPVVPYYDTIFIQAIRDVLSAENISIPEITKKRIREFLQNEKKQTILREELQKLIPLNEVEACFRRIRRVGELVNEGKVGLSNLLKMTYE